MQLLIIFSSIFFLALIGVVSFFVIRSKIRARIADSLDTKLFLVRLPLGSKEGKDMKREVGISEQLVGALASFGKPFTFEIAVPNIGEEIHFYVSVPGKARDAVARQIQALWKDASVEAAEEYNIFNYSGATAGVVLRLKEHYALPVRTYQSFDADTLLPVLGGLTKINAVGEGCAIQYVVRPATSERKSIRTAITSLKKGKGVKDIIKTDGLSWGDIEKALSGSQPKKEGEKVIDDVAIKAFETKLSKPLFRVNVRIVASAPSQFQADSIVDGIAAGFSQFATPERNEFRTTKPRKLQEFVHNFSFRDFVQEEAMVLNAEELASIFHFPTPFIDIPKVKYLKSREAPAPAGMPSTGLLLGRNPYRGVETPVRLSREDRRRHLYVVGQTGTGKSVFINNIAGQDAVNNEGFCVIDPNGDLFEDVLKRIPKERLNDVVIFDPSDLSYPLGLNMLEYDPKFPEQKTLLINELMMIFDTLYDMKTTGGPMFEQYARNALLLLMDDPSDGFTILEIPRVMTDAPFRKRLLEKCTNMLAKEFWEKEAEKVGGEASLANMAPYITSKFNTFIANDYTRPILAQSKNTIDFRRILDDGKILLVNLSKGRIGELNASLLGMLIVGKLTIAAFSRADSPMEKRRDFYLHIDEFQNFSTPSIAVILAEARKYRLCLTVAHQFIAQLKEPIRNAVFGNVGNMIAFRVGPDDAKFLVSQFAPVFNEADIINIDNLNAHAKILVNNQVFPAFNLFVPFPPKGDDAILEEARELSRKKYGRPLADVEAEIYARMKSAGNRISSEEKIS